MWELDCEESWALKNWCFWTVVLEKTLESPLDCKEVQPVHPKGDQPWDFFGRNDAKAETPVLWPSHAKSWPIGKDSDAGRDWGQEEKGIEAGWWGWDGWMASLTRWTWVWVNSRTWWWIGKPGMLRIMGSQRVGHDWATELNWGLKMPSKLPTVICMCVMEPRCKSTKSDLWAYKSPTKLCLDIMVFLPGAQQQRRQASLIYRETEITQLLFITDLSGYFSNIIHITPVLFDPWTLLSIS